MKESKKVRKPTNIFEIALHQEFRKLEIGEPDRKIISAMERAGKKVLLEVKRFMKEQQNREVDRRRKDLEKVRHEKSKTIKEGVRSRDVELAGKGQTEFVEDIGA